ncbi:MAG: hypothetical protein ISS48_02595 [Candidatus Aenigmarchaeota archaeon]|nr:hypothetical protein [Candidatus Aenigmarchaeota archaeon]
MTGYIGEELDPLMRRGEYQKTLKYAEDMIATCPASVVPYEVVIEALYRLERDEEVPSVLEAEEIQNTIDQAIE